MKLEEIKIAFGIRRRRKELLAQARLGVKKVRLVKQDGEYFVGVHHGPVYVTLCSPGFSTKNEAIDWSVQKTSQTPPSRVVQVAVVK